MRVFLLAFCFLLTYHAQAQYYLRGEVKDAKGVPLSGVLINLYSNGAMPFYSDMDGTFGITSSKIIDTVYLILDGYDTVKKAVNTQQYQVFTMKLTPVRAKLAKATLSSLVKNTQKKEEVVNLSVAGESYRDNLENDAVTAATHPEIGFAINIDRASYSNIRRFLNNQAKVPTEAVRIEEMLNYFNLKLPDTGSVYQDTRKFRCNSLVTDCPWNASKKLFYININAPKLQLDTVKPSNFVFLIDVSGSMDKDNRLPLLQQSFKLLTENLRDTDRVSIVTYGGGVHLALLGAKGSDKKRICDVIDSLSADGDTPGEGAIRTAYDIARTFFIKEGNNRVILATDGDFNVGQTTERELENLIAAQRNTGIYLTCLGVGMGNYKDSKLETLAKKGDGNFAYIDNIQEAEKVLVTELTKTMYNVANNTFVNVKFNAQQVKNYRLIGFDNKKDAIANPGSELEGGEVGSGHNLMALYEVELASSAIEASGNMPAMLADVELKYNSVIAQSQCVQTFDAGTQYITFNQAPEACRLGASVALFGLILRKSKFLQQAKFELAYQIAQQSIQTNNKLHVEFLGLIKKAEKIYRTK